MNDQFQDLYDLIARDREAHRYFSALPNEVREAVSWRAQKLHSLNGLQSCAQELLSDYD